MTTIAFSGSHNDTYSSPYYDYIHDAIYVGDNSGNLQKFTPVFGTGTPAVGTPVSLNTAPYDIASPVYDSTSGCVFVGDTEGYFYVVNSGVAGTVCTSTSFAKWGTSAILGNGAALEGIFDAPLVDSTVGMAYAFVTDSAHNGTCAAGDNCVYQFKVSGYTAGSTGTVAINNEEALGAGAAGYNIYDGTFDNVYYSSTGGTAGDLWVMGNTGAAGGNLYRILFTTGSAFSSISAAISGLTDTTAGHYAWASPITEFCNNGASACTASTAATTAGTDYIYFSVDRLATAISGGCGTASGDGCLLGYSIDTPASVPTRVGDTQFTTAGTPGCWTTGGIIVDNAVASGTLAGASQIYLYALEANGAGGPTAGTYASANCTNADTNTPSVYQESQSAP